MAIEKDTLIEEVIKDRSLTMEDGRSREGVQEKEKGKTVGVDERGPDDGDDLD